MSGHRYPLLLDVADMAAPWLTEAQRRKAIDKHLRKGGVDWNYQPATRGMPNILKLATNPDDAAWCCCPPAPVDAKQNVIDGAKNNREAGRIIFSLLGGKGLEAILQQPEKLLMPESRYMLSTPKIILVRDKFEQYSLFLMPRKTNKFSDIEIAHYNWLIRLILSTTKYASLSVKHLWLARDQEETFKPRLIDETSLPQIEDASATAALYEFHRLFLEVAATVPPRKRKAKPAPLPLFDQAKKEPPNP